LAADVPESEASAAEAEDSEALLKRRRASEPQRPADPHRYQAIIDHVQR
jgi:hypothetical protein